MLAGAAKIGVDDEHLQAGGGKSEPQIIDKLGLSLSGQGAGNGQDLELSPHAGQSQPRTQAAQRFRRGALRSHQKRA